MKQKELTLMYIKVLRFHNLEDTFSMIRNAGFEIIQISEESTLSKAKWEEFYLDYKENPLFNNLVGFSYSGPIVAAILEKENAIEDFCKLIGVHYGSTIADAILNLYGNWEFLPKNMHSHSVHGSDNPKRVKIEIELLFPGFNIDKEVNIKQLKNTLIM